MKNIYRFVLGLVVGVAFPASASWASDLQWKGIGIAGNGTILSQRAALRGDEQALYDSCGIAADVRAPPSLRKENLAICRSGIERLAPNRMGDKPHLVALMNAAKTTLKDARSTDHVVTRKPPAVSAECSNNQTRGNATDKDLARCCSEKLRSDDVDGAIADCSAALKINPRNRRAYSERGAAWTRKGKLENAISDLNQAVELEPKFIFSYISRAFIKAEAGDHNGAIADINLAIQDQPDSDWLYVLRGQLRKRAGDLDNAVQDYDRALYIKPTSARALYARGIANYLKGEYRLAVADIESSIILEPDKQGYKSVMLYLATIGNGGDGTSDLVNNTRHIDAAAWPAPIVSLFLEKSTPHELISSIQEQNPYKRRDRVCVANYFVSQRYLLRGEKTQATYFLRETIRHCPRSTIQYVGAVSDLK